jgi:hypothetical protein
MLPDVNINLLMSSDKARKSHSQQYKNGTIDNIIKIHKERIQSNVIQMAYVVLGLGNLIIDEEFLRPDNFSEEPKKQEFVKQQLAQFKKVYSDKLYQLVKKLVLRDNYHDVPCFIDLLRDYLKENEEEMAKKSRCDFVVNDEGKKFIMNQNISIHSRRYSDLSYPSFNKQSTSTTYEQSYSKDSKPKFNVLKTKLDKISVTNPSENPPHKVPLCPVKKISLHTGILCPAIVQW